MRFIFLYIIKIIFWIENTKLLSNEKLPEHNIFLILFLAEKLKDLSLKM